MVVASGVSRTDLIYTSPLMVLVSIREFAVVPMIVFLNVVVIVVVAVINSLAVEWWVIEVMLGDVAG